MPYPSEHAARVIDPAKFDENSFRRKNIADGVDIIIGKLKGEDSITTQSYRFKKDKFTADEAKKWLSDNNVDYIDFEKAAEEMKEDKEMQLARKIAADISEMVKENKKKEMTELETVNLTKEILTVGKFNGIDITESDLDEMIESFNQLKDRKEVSMRIGHTSDDKPNTKILRAGTVESLEKKGNKLVANIRNVPKQIYEFIQKELLKPVSIEFSRKWKDGETGKEYKNVLTAIALMGIAKPAVPGLADFEISFSDSTADKIKIEYQEEVFDMEVKELQEKAKALETELSAKATELSEKEAERLQILEQKKEAEIKLKEFQEKTNEKEILEFIEKNSSENSMKILPAERERIQRILKALDNETISFEEKEIKMTARQEFQEFISNLENRVEFKAKTQIGKIEKPVEFSSEDEKRDFIANEAKKLSKEKGISISKAQDELVEKYYVKEV